MKDAGVAPPGVMPIQQPTIAPRNAVAQYCGSLAQVCSTTRGLILALRPLKARPSSMVSRISPMPNKPMTAMRKLKPRRSSYHPNVMRSCPVEGSCPTAASAKPSIIDAMVFEGGSLLIPTKLQNARSWTANSSAGPNASAIEAIIGARNVTMMTANSAPKNEEVKAPVSASPARPCCAIG